MPLRPPTGQRSPQAPWHCQNSKESSQEDNRKED